VPWHSGALTIPARQRCSLMLQRCQAPFLLSPRNLQRHVPGSIKFNQGLLLSLVIERELNPGIRNASEMSLMLPLRRSCVTNAEEADLSISLSLSLFPSPLLLPLCVRRSRINVSAVWLVTMTRQLAWYHRSAGVLGAPAGVRHDAGPKYHRLSRMPSCPLRSRDYFSLLSERTL